MANLAAHCPKCGAVFNVPNFIGGSGSAYINLQGNSTPCVNPSCSGLANLVDGLFHLNNDQITLISGPPLSRVVVNRLKILVSSAKQKKSDAVEVLAELADISPELATHLKGKHTLPTFVILMVLIWLIKGVELNIKVDLNKLIDEAWHLSHHQDPDAHPAEAAGIAIPDSAILEGQKQPAPPAPKSPTLAPVIWAGSEPQNRHARRRQTAVNRKRKPVP